MEIGNINCCQQKMSPSSIFRQENNLEKDQVDSWTGKLTLKIEI